VKKKRKLLDTTIGKKPGARKGDVRNPAGKIAGTLTKATRTDNEAKITIIQKFQRSRGPHVLGALLDLRLPMSFIPKDMRERYEDGTLTDGDHEFIARMTRSEFHWAMDWIAKIMGKTVGVFGLFQHEQTVAGRTKRATVEDKSPGVVEMVKKKAEEDLYEADE